MWDLSTFFEQNIYFVGLAYGFVGVVLIQLLWYLFVFLRVGLHKDDVKIAEHDLPPVSVVICAKNEYDNLMNNLPKILKQDYPNFEIVVVNDGSDDETEFLLQDFCVANDNIAVVNFRKNFNFFKGKKFPLSLGIRSAKHDLVILTDADCYPVSDQWLKSMVKVYKSSQTEIVLGYGGYEKRPTFINKLIRFETMHIAMQYMGMTLCGLPYMGIGRNLSYRRGMFYRNHGFIYQYKIVSGDDDLFVNRVGKGSNTTIAVDSDSFTRSIPKTTFGKWIRQKTRHFSTSKHYKFRDQFLLTLYPILTIAFYTLLIMLLCNELYYPVVLSIAVFKILMQMLVYAFAARKFKEGKIWIFTPLLDVILLIINILTILFTKQKKETW